MDCSKGTKYIFSLRNKKSCPESSITFESPPITTEAEKEAFILKLSELIIQNTMNSNFRLQYDPNDVVPSFSFTIGVDEFIITLGPNPILVINGEIQTIPPNNIFSYEYTDSFGVVRKKNFIFYENFFKLTDEDSGLVYYSDLKIVKYENFDL